MLARDCIQLLTFQAVLLLPCKLVMPAAKTAVLLLADTLTHRPLTSPSLFCYYLATAADWSRRVVSLQVRDAEDGGVAVGHDGQQQQFAFSLDTCLPVTSA